MRWIFGSAAAALAMAVAAPASAQIAVEANGARSEGQWGGEFGVGYTILSAGGFSVTPGAGIFIYDDEDDGYDNGTGTKIYGRLEAAYTLPVSGLSVGAGARLIGDDVRPYATASTPLLPFVRLKGNLGPKYLAAGLAARF